MPIQLGRPFRPDHLTIDTLQACPDGDNDPIFALVSYVNPEPMATKPIHRNAFTIANQAVDPDMIAASLNKSTAMGKPTRIDIVQAHGGLTHDDPKAARMAARNDSAYVNELRWSCLIVTDDTEPYAAPEGTPVIDPLTAKVSTLGALAMVVPTWGQISDIPYPWLDSVIVRPGDLPDFMD